MPNKQLVRYCRSCGKKDPVVIFQPFAGGKESRYRCASCNHHPGYEFRLEIMEDKKKATCPDCGNGQHGIDSLCDDHWKEYLGTHLGGRGEDN